MLKKKKNIGIPEAKIRDKTYPSKHKAIAALVVLTLGMVMFPTSIFLNNVIAAEINEGIAEQITVPDPDDEDAYEEWKSNDYDDAIPMYTRYYMWNLTNPNELINGIKPIFEELGPYTFRDYSYKYDVRFDDDEDEVSFNSYTKHVFKPEKSGGLTVKDNITNINPAYLGVLVETGSEAGLIRAMFPKVLQEVRTLFVEELEATMETLLTNEGIYDMLVGALTEILGELVPVLNIAAIELIAEWIVDFLTSTLIPLEDLVEFMADAMPSAEAILFEEWANDYFPQINLNLSILFDHLLTVIDNLVTFFVDLIFFWDVLHLFDAIKNALYNDLYGIFEDLLLNSPFSEAVEGLLKDLIRPLGAQMVNEQGSATGEGVDIDGRDPYNYSGSYADLNISTYGSGGSGINQTQSQALWDNNNPISLTGFDGLENPIWFEALAGDTESKDILKDGFNLTETQLNYILDWIEVSINGWLKNMCEWQINNWDSDMITTRTVEEWLFYANDTLVYNQNPAKAKVGIFDNCQDVSEAIEAGVDRYTIKTGKGDINEVAQTVKFNGEEEINIWGEPEKIKGTDGTVFAPDISMDDTLEVFSSDLMRVVDFKFDKLTSKYEIGLYRFKLDSDTLEPDPNYYTDIEGIANMLKKHEAPVYLSKPHFLDGDKFLLETVDGLNPHRSDHDMYVEVEPITGLTMNARLRIQANLKVRQTDIWYLNITEGIMPILWLEQSGEITEELAEEFKKLVYGALDLQQNLTFMVLGAGAALCVPGAIVSNTQKKKRRNQKVKKILEASKKKEKLQGASIQKFSADETIRGHKNGRMAQIDPEVKSEIKAQTVSKLLPKAGIEQKKKLRGFAEIIYKQLEPLNNNEKFKKEFKKLSLKFLLNPIDQVSSAKVIFNNGTVNVQAIKKSDPLIKMNKNQIGYDAMLQVTTQMIIDIASGKMSTMELLKAARKDKDIKLKGKLKLLKLLKAFTLIKKTSKESLRDSKI